MNVIVMTRGDHRFVFLLDDDPASMEALMRFVGKMATDPDEVFGWYDAAVVSEGARNMTKKGPQCE